MANDGSEGKKKQCPFLGEYCIAERCALYSEVKQVQQGGMVRKVEGCVFGFIMLIISEMNQREAIEAQKKGQVQIPKGIIYRG